MAVFVSASDESHGKDKKSGIFLVAGYVAPEADWYNVFTPAWDERVLAGPPRIDYLHMADIRSRKWRMENGISLDDAERRVDEAVRVIGSMGSLRVVSSEIDSEHFRKSFVNVQLQSAKTGGITEMEPDYLCFLRYAMETLWAVSEQFPGAEKVDFIYERSEKTINNRIDEFHGLLAGWLRDFKMSHLGDLVGELIPAGKDRVPLQAADVFAWHLRRMISGELGPTEARRYAILGHTPGIPHRWSDDVVTALAEKARRDLGTAP